jgi:hypothetical protein
LLQLLKISDSVLLVCWVSFFKSLSFGKIKKSWLILASPFTIYFTKHVIE